jgi:hypothetical protein
MGRNSTKAGQAQHNGRLQAKKDTARILVQVRKGTKQATKGAKAGKTWHKDKARKGAKAGEKGTKRASHSTK